MQLKQLKLMGFKSFAIPTVIPFTSSKVAIVGPNGCGKSNIIDAIRWVLGEASAKNLRGELMSDVIFNGSENRKALGQASVELIFTNTSARLTGPFAQYQEISIRRMVSRDEDSAYFLNGMRCRRKDITDLFLGTGAGARSYSIIGQNTISELIEARPEELRTYLEEAAGISKYRERRRETLASMEQTKENLIRASDIQQELEKQLQRLERQAKNAEQYIELKQQERQFKKEIVLQKWQQLRTELKSSKNALLEQQKLYDAQSQTYAEHLGNQDKIQAIVESELAEITQMQSHCYKLNMESTRLKEMIAERDRKQKEWTETMRLLESELSKLEVERATSLEKQTSLSLEYASALENLNKLRSAHDNLTAEIKVKEDELVKWRENKSNISMNLDKFARIQTAEELKITHQNAQKEQISSRLSKIEQELLLMDFENVAAALKVTILALEEKNQELQIANSHHENLITKHKLTKEQLKECEQRYAKLLKDVQQVDTQYLAAKSTLQALLRKDQYQGIYNSTENQCSHLIENIIVEECWRFAVESIMGTILHAVVLDTTESLSKVLPFNESGMGAIFPASFVSCDLSMSSKQVGSALELADSFMDTFLNLTSVIQGLNESWLPYLKEIKLGKTLAEALDMLPKLAPYQSVVTIDGYWLGPGWIKFFAPTESTDQGIFARKKNIEVLDRQVRDLTTKLQCIEVERKELTDSTVTQEAACKDNQEIINKLQTEVALLVQQKKQQEKNLHESQQKYTLLNEENSELIERYRNLDLETHKTNMLLLETRSSLSEWQIKWENVLQGNFEELYSDLQKKINVSRTNLHAAELQLQKQNSVLQHLKEDILRLDKFLHDLQARKQGMESRKEELFCEEENTLLELETLKLELQTQNSKLESKQIQLKLHQDELTNSKNASQQLSIEMQGEQSKLMSLKMGVQGLEVKCESLLEAAQMTMIEMESEQPAFETSLSELTSILAKTEDKLRRLGAINLVAIEEYQETATRKKQFDTQCDDLKQSLEKLENAIEAMDKQSRSQLLDTFAKVNESFKNIFPKLFGGGHAQLTWTCDNVLNAGVFVMAQPPGKRNSSIQLLSGGEKAMTAIALVFSIFQLNPSPFCFLDEVDAPLDDLNINRFCDLVQQMAATVQFLMITHNKITMTLADHLIGVTMREPGVSRLVAVDMEQALAMME